MLFYYIQVKLFISLKNVCLATEEHVYNLNTWKAEDNIEVWDKQIV